MTEVQLLKMLENPNGRVDAVLDTDTYNEIDDQFALSYMLKSSDKINTKAIYAAPFFNNRSTDAKDGMEKSYDEIKTLLKLLDMEDVPAYKGSDRYLADEQTPVMSDAAKHLAELAAGYSSDNPLYVITIGAITNIASAILINPDIINNIVVVWLGGHSIHWDDTNEFNMKQDVAAARIVFGCGVPLVQLPCMGVVSAFTVSDADMKYWLKGKNSLCNHLVDAAFDIVGNPNHPWTRVIWDVTAVAWVLGGFTLDRIISSPIPEYNNTYSFDQNRHKIRYVYHIQRDKLFCDLVKKLTCE